MLPAEYDIFIVRFRGKVTPPQRRLIFFKPKRFVTRAFNSQRRPLYPCFFGRVAFPVAISWGIETNDQFALWYFDVFLAVEHDTDDILAERFRMSLQDLDSRLSLCDCISTLTAFFGFVDQVLDVAKQLVYLRLWCTIIVRIVHAGEICFQVRRIEPHVAKLCGIDVDALKLIRRVWHPGQDREGDHAALQLRETAHFRLVTQGVVKLTDLVTGK